MHKLDPAQSIYYGAWFMPFRVFAPKGEDTKTCLFVVTSTFAFRGKDTTNKGRQHERFLPADTKFFNKEIFVPSPQNAKVEITKKDMFHVFAIRLEITTKRHVFVSLPRKHEMA